MRWCGRHIICLAMCCMMGTILAQDIESLKDQPLLEYSGGVSATTTFYNAWGMENRRDPFFWQLTANLNFTILGVVHAPFSMTVSQQNKSFSQPQPFNRFGISPSYKGITLHLGHRSMNFSSYTLAGNMFLGIGAEYEPESNPLRVSAVYGRFAKPVLRSAQQGVTFAEPTFKRTGYGAKIGYEKNDQQFHFIMFTARDDPGSVPGYDSLGITPEENVVLGVETSFRILDRIIWSSEYAYSLYSMNSASSEAFLEEYTFVNNLGGLFTPTTSSRYNTALTTALAYQGDGFQLNGKYRRIDPGYTTLGSSFLNNDLEDISAGISFPVLNRRVTLSGNVGVQRNNLDNQLTTNLRRFIFSTSASWMAGEKLQVMTSYSNYNSSTTQVQIRTDVLEDSLEFFQVSRNGSVNINYTIGSGDRPLLISWLGSVQDATDSEGHQSTFISNTVNLQKQIDEWSLSFAGSANRNRADQLDNLSAGPVTTLSRSFQKGKYRTSLSSSVLNVYTDGALESRVTNFRLNGAIRAGERHNINISAFYVMKHTQTETEASDIQELRASVRYNFRI